jgi:arylsulfatase A-like enzyme
MYGHNNGVTSMYGKHASINAFRMPLYSNGTRQSNPRTRKLINNEYRTLNLNLQNIGYTTHAVGKFINGIENDNTLQIDYVPIGWDTFNVGADHFMYTGYRYSLTNWTIGDQEISYEWYGSDVDDYITDVLSTKATNIIKKSSEKPFFLYIAPTAPHVPMFPAERHRDKIDYWNSQYDKYVTSRPNFNANLNNKPHWLKKTEKERDELFNSNLGWNEMDWARRMSSLYSVDDLIQNVYEEVKLSGKLDNTIFILGSDNGYNLFVHKQHNKMSANEESMCIPLYISGKGFEKNKTDNQLALLIDIAPTIYDILGYDKPTYIDGYSLLTKQKRSSILFQYKNKDFYDETDNLQHSPELINIAKVAPEQLLYDVPPFTAIHTFDYVLIEYYNTSQIGENEYELYDLNNDPYQLTNIYDNEHYSEIKKNLTMRLRKLEKCTGGECIYI